MIGLTVDAKVGSCCTDINGDSNGDNAMVIVMITVMIIL